MDFSFGVNRGATILSKSFPAKGFRHTYLLIVWVGHFEGGFWIKVLRKGVCKRKV